MTFGQLWNPWAPTEPFSAAGDRYHTKYPTDVQYYAAERGDRGGYGSFGGSTKSKKAEKKQAAMSALTLIAFLFFLNILQSCLKDQKEDEEKTTIMMVSNAVQGRLPDDILLADDKMDDEQPDIQSRNNFEEKPKKRKLLSVEDDEETEGRHGKFIHQLNFGRDWSNDLTQVTDEDLAVQKEKVNQLRRLWNPRESSTVPMITKKMSLEEEVERVKVKKFINNPVLSDLRSIPKLSQYWATKKTSTEPPETKSVDFEEPAKRMADFHDFETLKIGDEPKNPPRENIYQKYQVREEINEVPTGNDDLQDFQEPSSTTEMAKVEIFTPPFKEFPKGDVHTWKPLSGLGIEPAPEALALTSEDPHWGRNKDSPLASMLKPRSPVGVVEAVPDPYGKEDPSTPRYRRSDETSTATTPDDLFYPENQEIPSGEGSTQKVYHVYTHPSQIYGNLWRTTTPYSPPTTTTTTTSTSTTTEMPKFDIASIYLTTTRPSRNRPSQRYPANHRPHYQPASRYEYSPYRRVSYEPPLVRQEYYPMSVVGQYGGDEENSGMGILQLLWSLVSTFARPIARLVPNASKVGTDGQCLDLLACEAQRMGQLMGPTAQTMANTFSSVLSWMLPEEERTALEDAIAAARNSNSCFRQIKACDDRSGGKSAMTMVAKLMELRPEKESRKPRLR